MTDCIFDPPKSPIQPQNFSKKGPNDTVNFQNWCDRYASLHKQHQEIKIRKNPLRKEPCVEIQVSEAIVEATAHRIH